MEEIKKRVERAISEKYGVDFEVAITPAPEGTGADYATNVAMKLAKLVHKAPMEIAEDIREEMMGGDDGAGRGNDELAGADGGAKTDGVKVEVVAGGVKVEVAAPGFLNFSLGDEYFAEQVRKKAEGVEMMKREYAGKTVIAEFSDPNPFKVLHVGHFYTSVVGDAISRLLELAGARVIRANFGGDVGLHVAKTLYALDVSLNEMKIEDIAEAYVEGTRAYEEDAEAKAEITELNKEIYRINAEDDHSTELAKRYWRGRELSYEYFEKFYGEIGVKFDKYYPESTVAGRGLKEVREHIGRVYEESDGAVVYHGEKVGLHTRVFINREGVPTYEAKDVGLIFTKWDDWKFDESVVVTGNEQTEYMKVVLASVSEYAPELTERTVHLTHGLVKLPGNVKMSSRKGNFLKAVDVLEMIREQLGGGDKAGDKVEEGVDDKVVLAAIKYAFLRYKMGGDIVFDPKESVSTTGNSGVYLLYSTVRAKKILQKASAKLSNKCVQYRGEFERRLSKKIVQYDEVLETAVTEKAPNKVCAYLYELAQEFSRFYENVKVAGSEREGELLVLVKAYLKVMEHGLGLLGIEVPEEM